MSTKSKIVTIIAENLGIDESEVTNDSMLEDDLGADSLDLVEILMAIEEEFDLEMDELDDMTQYRVSDIVAAVDRAVSQK